MSDLHGIEITVSDLLPATVKDKDGREVALLGVMMPKSPLWLDPFEPLNTTSQRIVLLVGES